MVYLQGAVSLSSELSLYRKNRRKAGTLYLCGKTLTKYYKISPADSINQVLERFRLWTGALFLRLFITSRNSGTMPSRRGYRPYADDAFMAAHMELTVFDASQSVMAGTRYIKDLYKSYGMAADETERKKLTLAA